MNDDVARRILDEVASAPSFLEAAERLTDAARELTGCHAAMFRFRETDTQSEGWIPALVERGFDGRFLRDEIMIGQEDCLCGRVCRGCPDARFPFFTPGGSFSWGAVQTIAQEYPVDSLGNIHGRCITEGFESLAIVPLVGTEGLPVGCLHLADFAPNKFADYTEQLEAIGRLCGPVLLRFSSEDREASVVRAVESALTPAEIHQVPGLDIAVSYTSATETAHLGGDFYDVIELANGEVFLVVGDYSGRGIGAAGMAARARYAIASAAKESQTLAGVLSTAETVLRNNLPEGKYITVVACRYSPDGRLEGTLAGHPPPLLLEPGGETRELLLPSNRPLGHFDKDNFQARTARLLPDQTLLLYTDGIVDSRREGRFFGLEGIAAHWRTCLDCELGELTAGLCRVSADFDQEGRGGDDRLALAARVVGGR